MADQNNYQKEGYQNQEQKEYGKGYGKGYYGKKNLWKWIIIYVIIGGIAYAAVYYFFFYGKGGYNYNSNQYPPQQNQNYQ